MNLELTETEKSILEAMVSNVIYSNIGTECLLGWKSTEKLSMEQIETTFNSLNDKIKNLK